METNGENPQPKRTDQSEPGYLKFAKKWWWAIGLVAIVVIAGIYSFAKSESIVSEGNKKQQELKPFYNETSNTLSDCIVQTKEAAGIAGAQSTAVEKVISEAVRGRYELPTSAQPGGGQESLFSAMVEAYPNTDQISKTYQDVLVVMSGCRTAFKNSQAELQKRVALFNSWREGSFLNRLFGAEDFPTNALTIEFEGDTINGKAALEQMEKMVLVKEAREGRDTGEIETINPFGENSAE